MRQFRSTRPSVGKLRRKFIFSGCRAFIILAGLVLYQSGADHNSVEAGTLSGAQIQSSGSTYAAPAKVMSAAQMVAFTGTPLIPPAGMVNAPTIPLDEYNALKAMTTFSGGQKPSAESAAYAIGSPALAFTTNFQGAIQGENGQTFVPPDVDSAVGPTQILQPTNSSLDVWSKTGVHLRSLSLNGFVGNFTDSLGDIRAMYDPNYNRWVVLIDDFSALTASGKPQYYIAVSQTGDATGAFYIFPVFFNVGSGNFFDFPQLGMDQDALLLTVNLFNFNVTPHTFIGPFMWAIPKAKVYNGIGFGVRVFAAAASTGTIAPPFVLDANGTDYFVAAQVGNGVTPLTTLRKFTMTEAGRSNVAVTGPVSIALPAGVNYITPPPNAPQTCTAGNTTLLLDTLDGRFQNRSYQSGTSLWQVHTTKHAPGDSPFPIPRFYQLNTSANTTVQTGRFDLSSTSYDFNPHIAANITNSAMVTWTATDPPNGKDAQVMFGGRTSATPLNTMLKGPSTASSTTCLKHNFDRNFGRQRWGDYSVVNLDSSAASTGVFWITNEKIIGNSSLATPTDKWATQITRVAP